MFPAFIGEDDHFLVHMISASRAPLFALMNHKISYKFTLLLHSDQSKMLIASKYSTIIYQPKSLLTEEQLKLWLTDPIDGLGIRDDTTVKAFNEEIRSPSDLFGMSATDIDAINTALSTRTSDARGRSQATHRLAHRAVMRLKGMTLVVTYLSMVRRNIDWETIQWTNVQTFLPEWTTLKKLAEEDRGDVPKFKQVTGMPRHVLTIIDYLRSTYGSQFCSLYYLVCPDSMRDESSPEDAPPLVSGRHFAEPHTRLVDEIGARVSRTTASAQADNELFFKILVESFVGSGVASQAEDFEHTRDGLGFWERLNETQCTDDHHEKAGEENITWMRTAKWPGPEAGPLVRHIDKTRRQWANYQLSQARTNLQDYTDHTRVGWLLASITSTDTQICIRKNHIKDDEAGIYKDDWEKAAIYLSKTDYEGKDKKGKRKTRFADADISEVYGRGGGGGSNKKPKGLTDKQYNKMLNLNGGMGKSGVELRWHSPAEYAKLNKAQRQELNEWRATQGIPSRKERRGKGGQGGGGGGGGGNAGVSAAKISTLETSIATLAATVSELVGSFKKGGSTQGSGDVGSVEASPTSGEKAETSAVSEISTDNALNTSTTDTAINPQVAAMAEQDIQAAATVGANAILKLKRITGGLTGRKE